MPMQGTAETYITLHRYAGGLLALPRRTEPPPYGDRPTPRPDTDQASDAYPVRWYPSGFSPRQIVVALRHRAGIPVQKYFLAHERHDGTPVWLSVGTV